MIETKAVQDSGTLILTLGSDTTIIQHFEISGDSIHTKTATLLRGIRITETEGVLYPNGDLKKMHSDIYKLANYGDLVLDREIDLKTTDDSTFIVINRNSNISTREYQGKCIVINSAGSGGFFLFPFWGFYAPSEVNDSIVSNQFIFDETRRFRIKRETTNSLHVGSNIMGYLTLQLDADNKLQSIDGIGSSLNFTGLVFRNLDFDKIVKDKITEELISGVKPPNSVRDTVVYSNGDLNVTVDYWRPSVRGRKIFGEVVPYNRFWRTGANTATTISLNQPLMIDDHKLEKGSYSIFTLPTANEWSIMFNKETKIWGTDYDASQDVLRVPLKIEALPNLVEQLTISIVPIGVDGGKFIIEWEKTKATFSFKSI